MNEVRQRLIDCFTTVFPTLTKGDAPSAEMMSVEGWDSLATMNLITVVEEEFQVPINSQDAAHFGSFREVMQYLENWGPKAASEARHSSSGSGRPARTGAGELESMLP